MKSWYMPYITGNDDIQSFPLSRYFPKLSNNLIINWINKNCSEGQTILDPFGSYPLLPLEAAKNGYRVFVTCNNPVLQFIYQVLCSAPNKEEFIHAVVKLANEKGREGRLENRILSFYESDCPVCKTKLYADSYRWNRMDQAPFEKKITCESCGADGAYPLSEYDKEVFNRSRKDALHRSRAVYRVLGKSTEQEQNLQDHLGNYQSRALTVLMILNNRITGSDELTPRQKELLSALFLSLCDYGSNMWPDKKQDFQPRSFYTPSTFIEFNLWKMIDKVIQSWCFYSKEVPITIYTEFPQSTGSICLIKGKLPDKVPELLKQKTEAVFGIFPLINQAFWHTTILWTGWIFGPENSAPYLRSLMKKKYSWNQITRGYHQILTRLRANFGHIKTIDLLLPTGTQQSLLASIIAIVKSNFNIDGLAFQRWNFDTQLELSPHKIMRLKSGSSCFDICSEALHDYLLERNEPVHQNEILVRVLLELIIQGKIEDQISVGDVFQEIKEEIQNFFQNIELKTFDFIDQTQKISLYSNSFIQQDSFPITEQVEKEFIRILVKHTLIEISICVNTLYERFPGLLTPWPALIQKFIETYSITENAQIKLNPEILPEKRLSENQTIKKIIQKIGTSLNKTIIDDEIVLWEDPDSGDKTSFEIMNFGVLSHKIVNPQAVSTRFLIIKDIFMPLLEYKFDMNPEYAGSMNNNIKILRISSILQIKNPESIRADDWQKIVQLDEYLVSEPKQLNIFQNSQNN